MWFKAVCIDTLGRQPPLLSLDLFKFNREHQLCSSQGRPRCLTTDRREPLPSVTVTQSLMQRVTTFCSAGGITELQFV
jgi:hypothetical protein